MLDKPPSGSCRHERLSDVYPDPGIPFASAGPPPFEGAILADRSFNRAAIIKEISLMAYDLRTCSGITHLTAGQAARKDRIRA
jgi:hypothetical protein